MTERSADAYKAYRMARAAVSRRIEYVILFVTARCNLLCNHCFYIDEIRNAKRKQELTIEEYEQIAGKMGTVLQVSLTGGEPFLRKDLAPIILAFHQHARTVLFNVTTNALLPDRIVEVVETVFAAAPAVSFRLGISIDGFEEVHDRTRGRKGCFKQVLQTVEVLRPLRKRFPELTVHVSTTLTRDNASTISDFIEFVAHDIDVDAHYLGHIRGNVTLDPGLKNVSFQDYRDAVEHLRHRWVSKAPYQNLLNAVTVLKDAVTRQILETDRYFFPCVAGHKMITIDEEGKVKPCEMLEQLGIQPYLMGDLRAAHYDIYSVLASDEARRIRSRIVDENCYCTFECANLCNVALKPTNFVKAATLYATHKMRDAIESSGRPRSHEEA